MLLLLFHFSDYMRFRKGKLQISLFILDKRKHKKGINKITGLAGVVFLIYRPNACRSVSSHVLCLAVDHREVYIMYEKWVTTRSLGTSDLKNQKSPNSYLQTVHKAVDAFKCSNSAKLSFFCLSCILVTPTAFLRKVSLL